MKLFIDAVGTISAVYDDDIAGLPIGKVQIRRASNVEFNHTTEEWEAISCSLLTYGELLTSGKNRGEVIKQEVKLVEQGLRCLHLSNTTPYAT